MIDIDTEDEALTQAIREVCGPSPWVRVGQKGMALAYRWEGQKNFKLRDANGKSICEFLGQGNQVVLPPSIHPKTGEPYTANADLWEVLDQIPPLGEDIENRLRQALNVPTRGTSGTSGSRSHGEGLTHEGGRHNRMASEIGRLRNMGYVDQVLLGMAHGLNQTICSPPLPENEIEGLVRDATNDWTGGDGFGAHDAGNAQRLVRDFAGHVRWVRETQEWITWTGSTWAPDHDGRVERLAKAVGAGLANSPSSDEAMRKFGWRSQSASSIKNMLSLAKSELGVTISAEVLDRKLDVLNTATGVVDLSTGELRAANPADYLTKCTGVGFDPAADYSRWERFLEEVFPQPGMPGFIQRLCGYIATGLTREHVAVFASGPGRNGKSLLFNTVEKALGDYGKNTPTDTFMQRHSGAASNDLARLNGARLVVANEGNRGQRLERKRVRRVLQQHPQRCQHRPRR